MNITKSFSALVALVALLAVFVVPAFGQGSVELGVSNLSVTASNQDSGTPVVERDHWTSTATFGNGQSWNTYANSVWHVNPDDPTIEIWCVFDHCYSSTGTQEGGSPGPYVTGGGSQSAASEYLVGSTTPSVVSTGYVSVSLNGYNTNPCTSSPGNWRAWMWSWVPFGDTESIHYHYEIRVKHVWSNGTGTYTNKPAVSGGAMARSYTH